MLISIDREPSPADPFPPRFFLVRRSHFVVACGKFTMRLHIIFLRLATAMGRLIAPLLMRFYSASGMPANGDMNIARSEAQLHCK